MGGNTGIIKLLKLQFEFKILTFSTCYGLSSIIVPWYVLIVSRGFILKWPLLVAEETDFMCMVLKLILIS